MKKAITVSLNYGMSFDIQAKTANDAVYAWGG